MTVPYAFGSATTSIPLSQLDANFNTPITLGNTAIQLGNTVTTLNNMTLANATVSSGNVTVTSASLSGNLTFTGTGNRITGDFSNATVANRVAFQTSTTNGATSIYILPNGTSPTSQFVAVNNSDPTNASVLQLQVNATDYQIRGGITGTGTYLPMTFYTNGSERMRIDTSGNVGIGTSSPGAKLDVRGSSTFLINATNPTAWTSVDSALTTGSMYNQWNTSSNIGISGTYTNHPYTFVTNNTERARIDSSGNVGIGTTSPSANLEVKGSSGQNIYVSYTSGSQLRLKSDSGDSGVGTTGSTPLLFLINNAEKMRIDTSGNLLVKKTSATSTVDNNVGAQLGASGKCIFEASGDRALILNRLSDNGIIQEFFRGAGNQVGNIQANTSSVAYNTSSDYRLKEDIAPMTGALAKVTQLKPVTYKWKSSGEDGQGFIAHELQAIVPDCVTGEKDAMEADGVTPRYQGIDTSFLVATLTAAIQEQQQMIETLQAKVAALEGVKK